MPLLIRGGTIITADAEHTADISCAGETITRIEPSIDPRSLAPGTEVIDASGKLIFPGFIDPHVHIHLPFMGTFARDDWASASRAALAGGTTTLIEMICPGPKDEPLAAFHDWRSRAAGIASVDYSFHQAVVRFDDLAQRQIGSIVRDHGIASLKVFLAYKGALDLSDTDLFGCMSLARDLGAIVAAHCENASAIEAMQKRLIAHGKTGPQWHEPSRPIAIEAAGVAHLCAFAELTGAHAYIVHTSCGEAVNEALAARARGVNVWVEAVAPHLTIDKTYAELPDFEGAKYIMSPPLRDARQLDALWRAIASRDIATIATDHAPFDFRGQKDLGRRDFTKVPNGIPSVQERPALIYTHGVTTGRIDLRTFVDACSTQAAKIFGLYPKKGAISIGSDADLVVWDPRWSGTLSKATSESAVDYCAFEGWPIRGRASIVTVRGKVQARDGKSCADHGRGRFLQRECTH